MFRYKFRKKKKLEKDINNAFLKILYENYEYIISAYSFQTIRKNMMN